MRKPNWIGLIRSTLWYALTIPLLIMLLGLLGTPMELRLSNSTLFIAPTASFYINYEAANNNTSTSSIVDLSKSQLIESFKGNFNHAPPGSADVKTGRYYAPEVMLIGGAITLPVMEGKNGWLILPEEYTVKFSDQPIKTSDFESTSKTVLNVDKPRATVYWQPQFASWQSSIFWMLAGLVGLGIVLIAHQLKGLIQSFKEKNPFARQNSKRLNQIGLVVATFAMIQVGLMYWWIQIEGSQWETFSLLEFLQLNYHAPLTLVAISAIVFLIGKVFNSGALITREQELTI